MLDKIVNIDLLRNPWNWIIVYLMVIFAVFLFTLVDPLQAGVNSDAASQQ
jgi:hypothetical protein